MTDNSEVVQVVLSPREAALRLGVSPSGLRRLAVVYAQVYEELPKDPSGTSRIWPQEAVGRLERARALMAAGQARSVADGLRAVEGGAVASPEAALALGREGRTVEALGVVSAQLEAVLEGNRRLEAEVRALREEVEASKRLLPANASPAGSELHERPPGLFVRAAQWLEQRLRGRG